MPYTDRNNNPNADIEQTNQNKQNATKKKNLMMHGKTQDSKSQKKKPKITKATSNGEKLTEIHKQTSKQTSRQSNKPQETPK